MTVSRATLVAGLVLATLGSDGPAADPIGPGMRRQPPGALVLPLPPTFDLTHIEPAYFARALGNDPARIFGWVRDEIGYEAYAGGLRGPRGTLMAMAGNSVDRAALLASLLERAGQRVRYARGTLGEREAAALVASMWTRPDRPLPPRRGDSTETVKALGRTLDTAVKRDYALIRERLGTPPAPGTAAPTPEALAKEARDHYWVQWSKDGQWVDLDPSFGDAPPGRASTRPEETFDALPARLFHEVTIRVRAEEYTGAAAARRDVLTYTARAADLSGVHVVLAHVPEHWQGPARSLAAALSSAIADTGRVKPILLVGPDVRPGEPFRTTATPAGIGGVGAMLRGEGTRHSVAVATAEWLELDLAAPGGPTETVSREIFDLVGPEARTAGRSLTAAEVQTRMKPGAAPDLRHRVYSVLLTTGRVDAGHVLGAQDGAATSETPDSTRPLLRLNVAFAVASDALLGRLGPAGRPVALFYPDSPRVTIVELSSRGAVRRLSLDLRRDHARALLAPAQSRQVVSARILRGVVDGTLERVLVAYLAQALQGRAGWDVAMSASTLFERARAEQVPVLTLPREADRLDPAVPAAARARLSADTAQGYVALAPQRPFQVGGVPRFGWWRVDPRSGESTAMTDDGLHQAAGEYHLVRDEQTGRTYVVVTNQALPEADPVFIRITTNSQLEDVIRMLMDLGFERSTMFLN